MAIPLMSYVTNAAFASLEQWVRKGIPAPRAERIQIKNPGTPQAAVSTDALGHGIGGVRNTYVEVPAAKLATNSPGPGVCREMGSETAFDEVKFQTEYPNPKTYTDRVGQVADRLVKEKWLTESDAKKIKRDAKERQSNAFK
jgi:hypothetical protein